MAKHKQRFQHYTDSFPIYQFPARIAELEFEGWELITAIYLGGDESEYRCFFKRPFEAE